MAESLVAPGIDARHIATRDQRSIITLLFTILRMAVEHRNTLMPTSIEYEWDAKVSPT
jgi:hypothetical protein